MELFDEDHISAGGKYSQLRELFEATSDCVFVLDKAWKFVYFNAKAIEELNARNFLGSVIWDSFPAASGTDFGKYYREVSDLGVSRTFEAFYPPLNASYEVHAVPFFDTIVVFFRNISERKAASEALVRRHDELDAVLGGVGVGIMQYAENDRLLVINEHFRRILGRSQEELDGVPMEAFTHPDDLPVNVELLRRHRETGTPFSLRKRYVRPNGEVLWCWVSVSFVHSAHAEETTTVVVARDISEEVAAEQRAREVQTLLQAVVDNADDLIFVKNDVGRLVLVSEKMNREFGVTPGQTGSDRFPELAERFDDEDRLVMETGQRAIIEEEIRNGCDVRFFQTIKVPWRDDGEIRGVIGIARDISQRIRTERALRESEERYRFAAMATRDVIWEWDIELGTVNRSDSANELAGQMPDGTLAWWTDRIHPDDRDPIINDLNACLQGGEQRWECQYRFQRADGSVRHVHDRGFALRNADGKAMRMIGAASDITERIRSQEKLNRLHAELVHFSRISAMGAMGSTVAHEINQPLTAAGAYLLGARRILAAEGSPNAGEVQQALSRAQKEIARAGGIIRSLRQMVERKVTEKQPVPLAKSIAEVLAISMPEPSPPDMIITIDVPPELEVCADPVQLQQVLLNLVRNAAEAIAVSDSQHILITATQTSNEVIVEVTDSGGGIDPAVKERLFSAFASTKSDGLGVGLSICRTIIEAHGGKISALQRSGVQGTTFRFSLPVA